MIPGIGCKLMRIFITLLGAAFMLQAVGSVVLGLSGERTLAVITAIRRELGERGESVPNRYTYIISYTFTTPDGQVVDASTRRIGSSVYVKATGQQQVPVRYFQQLPVFNQLEQDTRLSWGSAILLAAGVFLVVAMNRPCGSEKFASAKVCRKHGTAPAMPQPGKPTGGLIGFSPKINDPAFVRYVNDTSRWAFLFSFILAVIVIAVFYIYGETSREMSNPEALYIGFGIGGMFIAIAALQETGRQRTKNWDGVVVNKKIEQKQRKRDYGNNDYVWEAYTLYAVAIRSDAGETYTISAEDDVTRYQYYQIGDRVRYHKGLNSHEKYDKSKDNIIFCNACASLNDIQDDVCFRCKCPLLK
ncbi:hypothetical protein [Sporomusa malonica]|uniref:DUF3592 domain-containing protein n=1 Tax=Sporomusa malonica TaxID=112901 RepID=A0A1W1YFV2_9FIRM|nr:hypothetical protein [Sporomusa malonica]SMC35100.1 hypothetical protein SAMN04488500_101330 [Sporomusa malonica]